MTKKVRLKADTTYDGLKTDTAPNGVKPDATNDSLQPWQFFVLAALACATALTFMIRGQGLMSVILLTVLVGTAALAGLAALRTVAPLVGTGEDRTVMIGERTRAALEREKMLTLRGLKELEFDRAMGKVAEEDFREMTGRLRARATRLIRQLDSDEGYRVLIERELAKRMGETAPQIGAEASPPAAARRARTCANCSTMNDPDAKFCKGCGTRL